MKTRELSMEEKQDILKLREEGNSIRAIAQTLAIASTTIWNVLKKKETTGVLSNGCRTGRPRKTSAVDDRNIVRTVKKNPKSTVSDITNNLQRAGVKVSQSTVRRRLWEQNYVWTKKGSAHDPKHTSSSVKHGGGDPGTPGQSAPHTKCDKGS